VNTRRRTRTECLRRPGLSTRDEDPSPVRRGPASGGTGRAHHCPNHSTQRGPGTPCRTTNKLASALREAPNRHCPPRTTKATRNLPPAQGAERTRRQGDPLRWGQNPGPDEPARREAPPVKGAHHICQKAPGRRSQAGADAGASTTDSYRPMNSRHRREELGTTRTVHNALPNCPLLNQGGPQAGRAPAGVGAHLSTLLTARRPRHQPGTVKD